MEANILTIGTEVVSGEIVNTNASWVAQQIENRGYSVKEHISVRDEGETILKALDVLKTASVLIVTGGLGPTSDDITREMVARWVGQPLEFSEPIWKELCDLYEQRGLPIREAHRHQCYFPKGCRILRNLVGTAHGFQSDKDNLKVYVLPGPPRELDGMWRTEVAPHLIPGGDPVWSHWSVLGTPESEVAEAVEPIIAGLSLEVGYRASAPYVHVKIRGERFSEEIEQKIDEAFAKWTAFKGKRDFAEDFFRLLRGKEILFQDQLSRGILSSRLHQLARRAEGIHMRIEACYTDDRFFCTTNGLNAQLLRVHDDENAFEIVWRDQGKKQQKQLRLPYQVKVNSERGAKAAAEWALFHWWNWCKA